MANFAIRTKAGGEVPRIGSGIVILLVAAETIIGSIAIIPGMARSTIV
jgi:hypothetical protein